MNKRNYKLIAILICFVFILAIITKAIYSTEFKTYSNITITLMVLTIVITLLYLHNTKSDESIFKAKIKNIINTYDSILVKVDILPDLSNKDIVYIDKFESLIKSQGEVKKPIFYSITEKTASFVLIDNNLVCYSIIKEKEDLIDPVESKLMIANAKKNVKDIDESILADLEHTTIIKLPNIGTYKVSPVRKKEENKDTVATKTESEVEVPVVEVPTPAVEEQKDKFTPKKKNHATERARKFREQQRKAKKWDK